MTPTLWLNPNKIRQSTTNWTHSTSIQRVSYIQQNGYHGYQLFYYNTCMYCVIRSLPPTRLPWLFVWLFVYIIYDMLITIQTVSMVITHFVVCKLRHTSAIRTFKWILFLIFHFLRTHLCMGYNVKYSKAKQSGWWLYWSTRSEVPFEAKHGKLCNRIICPTTLKVLWCKEQQASEIDRRHSLKCQGQIRESRQ